MTRRHHPPDPPADASAPERVWMEFRAALDALPMDTRAAFVLHQFFGLAYADIAMVIGQSPDACHQHVHLARQAALQRLSLSGGHTGLPSS